MTAVRKKKNRPEYLKPVDDDETEVLDDVQSADASDMSGGGSQSSAQPELPDGGGEDDQQQAVAAAMLSVSMAAKCFKADPSLGDPVKLAGRFYDFIFE